MKSIVIICKGPSVKRCTREFIDQFDEVVICGYPVLDNFFFKLISGKKIKFHFANCGDFDKRYTDKINELLKIDKVINTNVSNNYMNFLENKDIFLNDDIYHEYITKFKELHYFKPSTGLAAFNYILNLNVYDKIGMVGFDNFEKGTERYYFNINKMNPNLNYLIGKGVITKDGKIGEDPGFEHSPEKTYDYLITIMKNNHQINFDFITNMKIDTSTINNLKIQ